MKSAPFLRFAAVFFKEKKQIGAEREWIRRQLKRITQTMYHVHISMDLSLNVVVTLFAASWFFFESLDFNLYALAVDSIPLGIAVLFC